MRPDAPLTIEERREQYQWALNTLRLGQSGNRAALHAELLRQENAVIALLKPEDQERFRRKHERSYGNDSSSG